MLPRRTRPEATSAHSFRYDVQGTPHSPWNKSAARVFADAVIQKNGLPNTVEMFDALQRAFTAHLETIIRRYRSSLKSPASRAHAKSIDRRQTRKYTLFYRRRWVTYNLPALARHIEMVEELGIDGMSDTESEVEADGSDVRYYIVSPKWRAGRITPWLRFLDSVYKILRRGGASHATRGALPGMRIPTNRKSTISKYVAGLPINAYDTEWMDEDLLRKNELRTRQPYDFSHDPDLILYVIIMISFFSIPDQLFEGWLFKMRNKRRCIIILIENHKRSLLRTGVLISIPQPSL
ncbi:hypothetical protein B0H11DRAFT_1770383 [Mycena galericulata]|nr:hypothetical protein B0H11DRAFT_1770383 [Mycena galericulata]